MSVRLETAGRVATLTLDRPPLNVLDLATLEALDSALAGLAAGGEPPQVLLVTAAGERAFSAGVAVEDHTAERVERMLATFHGALRRLRQLPAVSVAVVRGLCLGGGLELAASCDLVVAADDAELGQPEIAVGCFPPLAAALYPSALGPWRAAELLLTGRRLGAAEAAAWGLVNRCVPAAELSGEVASLVGEITAHSAAVTRLTRRALDSGREAAFEAALAECERLYSQELCATEDMQEGLDAFLDKRPPHWRHR